MRRKKKRKYYYYISKLKRYAINAIKKQLYAMEQMQR